MVYVNFVQVQLLRLEAKLISKMLQYCFDFEYFLSLIYLVHIDPIMTQSINKFYESSHEYLHHLVHVCHTKPICHFPRLKIHCTMLLDQVPVEPNPPVLSPLAASSATVPYCKNTPCPMQSPFLRTTSKGRRLIIWK